MDELYLGIDVGTTGTKTLLADARGNVLGAGYREYALNAYPDGRVEQNADYWLEAVMETVRTATAAVHDRSRIRALSLSTQGASMLAVDGDFRPLGPVITWMDNRAADACDALTEQLGAERLYRMSGWGASATLDAAKILWMRENAPEQYAAASFVSTLEYVNRFLTGQNVIDPTNASIRQLYDITEKRWDLAVLEVLGISEERLPRVLPTGALVGTLTPAAAALLGLPDGVRVYNGAHDQYCASLGCGAVSAGDALLSTGTTWVLLGVSDRLLFTESRIAPGIHPVGGLYGHIGSLVSAGCALKWWKEIVDGDYRAFDDAAASRRASARELYFYPFVAGAGFPHKQRGELTGTLTGLRLAHDRYDIALALMEGVAFEARTMLGELKKHGVEITELRVSGGAARSRVWCEITAAVTGCRLWRMREAEAACMGAVMLACVGEGAHPSFAEAARSMVNAEPLDPPAPELRAFYEEKYAAYQERFPAYLALQ